MVSIIVVDDDKNIRKLISEYLKTSGYSVLEACDGKQALDIIYENHIDLAIIDVMMPNVDGYELTDGIRSFNSIMPILMVTAKDTFEYKQKGFKTGVDDYMTKPIDMDELLLRVAALLRRSKINSDHKIEIGNIIVNMDTSSVVSGDFSIELPKKEFLLLYKLLSYPKIIFTRNQLLDEIWGMDSETDERTVDVHIKRLREKLDSLNGIKIITVRGLGYKAEKII